MKSRICLILTLLCFSSSLYSQDNSEKLESNKVFYESKIDLKEGTQKWSNNVASIIFDDTISEDEKTLEFHVFKQDNNLIVNGEMPLRSDKLGRDQNCNTEKKTCRSEKCVANTLIEILGDGSRNVLIRYERKMLSVQIYYTYQDC
jgi:hypothetical protein